MQNLEVFRDEVRGRGSQGSALLKQKELNEIHVRDTFRKLKIWASSIRC
jgi:hypothetical protein